MKRIRYAKYAGKLHYFGNSQVLFDAEGVAVVPDELAANIKGIVGIEILGDAKQPVTAVEVAEVVEGAEVVEAAGVVAMAEAIEPAGVVVMADDAVEAELPDADSIPDPASEPEAAEQVAEDTGLSAFEMLDQFGGEPPALDASTEAISGTDKVSRPRTGGRPKKR